MSTNPLEAVGSASTVIRIRSPVRPDRVLFVVRARPATSRAEGRTHHVLTGCSFWLDTVPVVRILVTNDDGIDSVGLHHLARAMTSIGDVVVAAPDREYSGASAAFGALHLIQPEVHRTQIEGVPDAWSVSGPPALCVMFSRLGTFGPAFDLVVSGINPGANVGRAVYHSGTVGAALTARNGGVTGIAVSQAVDDFGIEGQGWDQMLANMQWEAAAEVAQHVVRAVAADLPSTAQVLNVNVPNLPVSEMKGYRITEVGHLPPRTMSQADLVPKLGHEGAFTVTINWGESHVLPSDTDGGAVMEGYVALSWLSRMVHHDPSIPAASAVEAALSAVWDG